MAYALKSPITIQVPSPAGRDISPITLTEIDYSVSYDSTRKVATAYIKGANRMVELWRGADYDKAGQFTDTDTDNRIKEILGKDPAAYLTSLYKKR